MRHNDRPHKAATQMNGREISWIHEIGPANDNQAGVSAAYCVRAHTHTDPNPLGMSVFDFRDGLIVGSR